MNEPNIFRRKFSISIIARVDEIISSLSLTGKLVFFVVAAIFMGSAFFMLANVSNAYLVAIPRQGGTLTEGAIGMPRFANPVLAVTDGDKDVAALVYSGLLRHLPGGSFVPDLAESYTVSPDGKIYTFTLRSDVFFHDGKPVTADDVEFTVHTIQNPAIKSGRFANWEGVSVEKTGDKEIRFTLRQPYAPFVENLTLGILPKHLWQNLGAEEFTFSSLNMKPIGSGPYQISAVEKSNDGAPRSVTLEPFARYPLGSPSISKIIIRFYPNEKGLVAAYRSGEIESMNSISPNAAADLESSGAYVVSSALPRVFGVFFNQTENPILAAKEVRQALNMSIDRQFIVDSVLAGFGKPLTEPVPSEFAVASTSSVPRMTGMTDEANALLQKNGWVLNNYGIREKKDAKGTTTLAFSISTSDAPELRQTAEILRDKWKQIGVDVTIKVFEGGNLNQNVIKPRKYDALLFGQVINRDLDLYAFWHSSQIADPGLNIALYGNKAADKFLEEMRITLDLDKRLQNYAAFANLVRSDMPAAFLYVPDFIYVVPKKISGLEFGHIAASSERFSNIFSWYINTDKIWKIFLSKN